MLAVLAPAARAQRLELRAGGVISSALASDGIAPGAQAVTVHARPAALLGLTALLPVRPRWLAEANIAWAFSELRASDRSGSWRIQRLGIAQALVGVRRALSPDAYARAAAGLVRYISPAQSIFAGGAPTEPALELAVGASRALGPWRLGGELGIQVSEFGPPTLREAGAGRGAVRRGLATLVLSRGVQP